MLRAPKPTPKVVLKRGEEGIEPVVLRVPIPIPKINPKEKEMEEYEEMTKKQKRKVDKLLKEFFLFSRNQMTRLIVA